jgi:putative DNA primase/helicase
MREVENATEKPLDVSTTATRNAGAEPFLAGPLKRVGKRPIGEIAEQVAEGGVAIFPLKPLSKTPLIAKRDGGQGCKDATADLDRIRDWWTKTPDANIGLATGKINGITVLDVDIAKDGDATLDKLLIANGEDNLPTTTTVKTWSGGRHYYFQYEPGIGNSAGTLGKGLDVRNDGGYVVGPMSVILDEKMAATGIYEFEGDSEAVPLAKMPPWMVALLRDGGSSSEKSPFTAPATIPAGERNDTLFRTGRSLKAKRLGDDAIRAAIIEENRTKCDPPLDATEVEQIIRSVLTQADRPDFKADTDTTGASTTMSGTGLGNAARFIAKYSTRVRYVKAWKVWLIWGGTHWKPDLIGAVMELAKEVAVEIYRDAIGDKKATEWAKQTAGQHRLDEMLALASTDPRIAARPGDFDRMPFTINVQNGTIDLKTGRLRPHEQSDMLSKIISIDYVPGAQSDLWDCFLQSSLPDREKRGFVQRVLGAALLGDPDQKFYFAQGPPAAGKSTLINAVRKVFGTYGGTVDPETLLKNRPGGIRDDLASLVGLRLVTSIEPQDGRGWDAQRIQQLTGGDPVKARLLYANLSEYVPQFTIVVGGNTMPTVPSTNDAFWRRCVRIVFDQTVVPKDRDRDLPRKLSQPEPQQAILAWLVKGCLAWQRDPVLVEPASVVRETEEYRQQNDSLQGWLDECVDLDPTGVENERLYGSYLAWCSRTGERDPIKAGRTWSRALTARGFTVVKDDAGRQRGWRGGRVRNRG